MSSSLDGASRLSVTFDDWHAVANAGHAREFINVKPFPGCRVATLVQTMVKVASCIDVPRCGTTMSILAYKVMAPSTLGAFLRRFTCGHVRQFDALSHAIPSRFTNCAGTVRHITRAVQ